MFLEGWDRVLVIASFGRNFWVTIGVDNMEAFEDTVGYTPEY